MVNDGDADSNNGDVTLTVAAVNDAPVVTPSGAAPAFTEGGGAVTVDGSIGVSDVDDTALDKATVEITNLLDGTDESLAATASGGIVAGDITYNSATGVLTIDPAADQPIADFVAVLQSVVYDNADQDPDTTDRIIRFVVNDGDADSNNGDVTLTVTAV